MTKRTCSRLTLPLVGLLALLSGCGGHDLGGIDDVVGAACRDDRDCDTRCYRGSEFPNGFCSLPCQSDQDCPGDTYCIDTSGGVCMYACAAIDCDRLGAGWRCRDRRREGGGGNVAVCSGN